MALISLRFSLQPSLQFSWTSRRLWPWIPTIRRWGSCAPYTTLKGAPHAPKPRFPALEVKHPEYAKANQADEDQIDRHDEIEQSRHQQDQNSCNQGHDGGHVRGGDGHRKCLRLFQWEKSNRGRQS